MHVKWGSRYQHRYSVLFTFLMLCRKKSCLEFKIISPTKGMEGTFQGHSTIDPSLLIECIYAYDNCMTLDLCKSMLQMWGQRSLSILFSSWISANQKSHTIVVSVKHIWNNFSWNTDQLLTVEIILFVFIAAWTWFQSGINTDGAHNPVTTRKVEKGDILSINCFPMISGWVLECDLFYGVKFKQYWFPW